MTQQRFAELLDISVDFLSLIERGRNVPSFETLEKMAKRLRVEPCLTSGTAYKFVPGGHLVGRFWATAEASVHESYCGAQ